MKMILSSVLIFLFISCGRTVNQKLDEGDDTEINNFVQCQCASTDDKICGSDGITYINDCVSSCYKVTTASQGACAPYSGSMNCTAQFDPVCGFNGITYSNSCIAGLNNVTSFKSGSCP